MRNWSNNPWVDAPSQSYISLQLWRKWLFNDPLNTFYLQLYGVVYMVHHHSDGERRNLLPPLHGIPFQLAARDLLYATDRISHTSLCYTSSRKWMSNFTNFNQFVINPLTWSIYRMFMPLTEQTNHTAILKVVKFHYYF